MPRRSNRPGQIRFPVLSKRLPQSAYMHIDGTKIDIEIMLPNPLKQLVAAPDPAWPAKKRREDGTRLVRT